MNISVHYSPEIDAENYVSKVLHGMRQNYGTTHSKEYIIRDCSENIKTLFTDNINEEQLRLSLTVQLRQERENNSDWFNQKIQELTETWQKVGSQIEHTLARIYNRPFPFTEDTLTVNFTTLYICPYKYEQRMTFCAIKRPIHSQILTLLHELNHFVFYRYFWHLHDKLDDANFELLKESMTFFSNPESPGYPAERPLRDLYLSQQWNSIDDAIQAAVNQLKAQSL